MNASGTPVTLLPPTDRSAPLPVNIGAGLLSAVVMLCYALSYAALIFSGSLTPYLPAGVLVTLVSCIVVAPVIAMGSTIRFMIGGPDGNASAILAGLATGIAADMAAGPDLLVTLLAALALASVVSGLLLYLLGATHGSAVIQFLPFPVIGGYLAGTGYLLLAGAFRVLTGHGLHWSQLDALLSLPWLAWLPAVVVCAALMIGARTLKRFTLVVPVGISAGLLVFFAGMHLSGMTAAQARQLGLLFEAVPLSALQAPLMLPLEQIHWHVILGHAPEFLAVVAVSALTILLNATGAGLACQQDPNLDREMRAAGAANVLGGLCGGIVGYQSLSRTMLNRRAGASDRSSGIAAAVGCLLVVVLAPGLIGWMPKSVLVGLQLYIAIGLIQEWLINSYRKLGRAEYLLIPLIVLVIAVHGVVAGIALGILAACVLFVVKYGRVSVIRSEFDLHARSSNVERSIEDTARLREHGRAVIGASLHGFLFFATANSILSHVRERLAAAEAPRVVLLDFRQIDGLDASTSVSFLKLRQSCDIAGVRLVLTALPADARQLLERAGLFSNTVLDFDSLDAGLEWAEEQILAAAHHTAQDSALGLQAHFTADVWERLEAQLEQRELAAGQLLFARGDAGDAVYIVEHGRVTVSLPLADGGALRLRSFGAGTIVGEMALYTQNPRSADVRADVPTRVRRLSLAALQRMEHEDGASAQQFHRFVVNVLASRLTVANEAVRAAY
ncbi:cyclic nucleotide-binding domain-containing protein [Pseudoduganella sp. FT55W]|uniref:Cyclic nucleotide-binding domain-containing protein n=1 Tax=Duganella rivi TaxID=2666083 RepID=A0A7X4KBN3_9BURK|nr:SulP family inorganic anion transporter [Duganella rivi]MYM68331.1 cyclic nucleotide-binding domain-containing protein [Duganella rivi]